MEAREGTAGANNQRRWSSEGGFLKEVTITHLKDE